MFFYLSLNKTYIFANFNMTSVAFSTLTWLPSSCVQTGYCLVQLDIFYPIISEIIRNVEQESYPGGETGVHSLPLRRVHDTSPHPARQARVLSVWSLPVLHLYITGVPIISHWSGQDSGVYTGSCVSAATTQIWHGVSSNNNIRHFTNTTLQLYSPWDLLL